MSDDLAFKEAAVGILAAIAEADGKITDEEIAWWRHLQARHPWFADLPPSVLGPMLTRARETISRVRLSDALAAWASDVPREHSEMLFSMAVDMMFIDSDVASNETTLIMDLEEYLELSEEQSGAIISKAFKAYIDQAPVSRREKGGGSRPQPRHPESILQTKSFFHEATRRLHEDAKVALAQLLAKHEVEMRLGLQKPIRDECEGFADYGWVMLFDKHRRTDVPLVLCFGFAINLETGEWGQMTLRREPTPHRIWIRTDDLFYFDGLYEAVAEELQQVL